MIKELQSDAIFLRTRINDFFNSQYEKTQIEPKIQEIDAEIAGLFDKRMKIMALGIDDEKKEELCSGIQEEIDSLNLELSKVKSRKVLEFTTTESLTEKCRKLKGDIDPLDPNIVKSLFEAVVMNGKEEMYVVMRSTNRQFNDDSLELIPFLPTFLEGKFTFNKKKNIPVTTNWKLILY